MAEFAPTDISRTGVIRLGVTFSGRFWPIFSRGGTWTRHCLTLLVTSDFFKTGAKLKPRCRARSHKKSKVNILNSFNVIHLGVTSPGPISKMVHFDGPVTPNSSQKGFLWSLSIKLGTPLPSLAGAIVAEFAQPDISRTGVMRLGVTV